ncbi:MAG: DUF2789 domain-containing protein [Gammaproteobacteria bacterium]|uniref:DUF2789 domain-containing protein n=1 Tax=Tolumonas osonensis TaxID=675874 RepID=A0A841GB29_9GAMM|nr:DUF2789 domain-containing protein [Tolumonas osonensis]MBB6054827.1 hypothetical protein [Tolumonas osonensis]NCB59108.1 DUF2789 domain-containing protein [Gammaproteobacteria bacterium]
MDIGTHDLAALFSQLGLANDEQSICRFIESHPLSAGMTIGDAPFWTAAQVEMLQQAFTDDAEWAEAVDTLATLLAASSK